MSESIFASSKQEALGERGMVATKHRLASAAGLEMLRGGGNVIDAAVAAAFAVGVVEPASSGIGGGGYLVYQVGERGGVFGFPMRAPLDVTPDMYRLTGAPAVGAFGWPGVEDDANLEGPRSVAVPGAVAGLTAAHRALGRLPLDEVVAPAVELARSGFAPEFHDLMAFAGQTGKLTRYPELRRAFLPGGELPSGIQIPGPGYLRGERVWAEPARIRQPDLADTLQTIGTGGADGFYRGGVADRLVDAVQGAGGMLSHADLERYRPFHWHAGDSADGAPLEVRYRNLRVRVAPFASGGITSAMTLQLLDRTDLPPAVTTPPRRCTATSARRGWPTPTVSPSWPTRRAPTCPGAGSPPRPTRRGAGTPWAARLRAASSPATRGRRRAATPRAARRAAPPPTRTAPPTCA